MNKDGLIKALIAVALMGNSIYGCRKDDTISKPVVVSFLISERTSNSALSGGEVLSDGGSAVTARGVCWGIVKHPVVTGMHTVDGTGTGVFSSSITGLTANMQYFTRAFASNSAGTAYGKESVFTTTNTKQVSDVDGNIYNTIKSGTQTWFMENLRTTRYNDSTVIPGVNIALDWSVTNTPAYCWYNNDSLSNKDLYGALYNWYAIGSGKLCPTGWHVPTDEEWSFLEISLGMQQPDADATGFRGTDLGIRLRSTSGWNNSGNGTNSSGFSALASGARNPDGSFEGLGNGNNWWSSSEYNLNSAWKRGMYYSSPGVFRGNYGKQNGYSVRCLKDN
jgi:uncharacterized protein (TIGR02145 family)